jgi:hypothetical protein
VREIWPNEHNSWLQSSDQVKGGDRRPDPAAEFTPGQKEESMGIPFRARLASARSTGGKKCGAGAMCRGFSDRRHPSIHTRRDPPHGAT